MQLRARSCAFLLLLYTAGCARPEQTPEEVVQRWQHYIDYNQFDSARLYSTELARSYVDFIDALTAGDSTEIYETHLYDLRCTIYGDSAACYFLIEGELGEKLPDTLALRKVSGHWRVHRVEGFAVHPVDTLQPGDENLPFPGDSPDVELE